MFEWIYSPEAWLALVTLTSLEIVLGIDNIIFISILAGRCICTRQCRRNRATSRSFPGARDAVCVRRWLKWLFLSHPPLEERSAALQSGQPG